MATADRNLFYLRTGLDKRKPLDDRDTGGDGHRFGRFTVWGEVDGVGRPDAEARLESVGLGLAPRQVKEALAWPVGG